MSFFDSSKSKFELDDTGGQQRDLSAYITEIDGLPGARNLNDVTALADSGAKRHPSIEDVSISLRGWFDNTASSGPDAVLGPLRTHTSATDFEYGPEGNSASDIMYTGTCWVESYVARSRVGGIVEWSATLKVEGVVTRAAHA